MGQDSESELQSYLDLFKVNYGRNPTRIYKLILKYIADEVASKSRVSVASSNGTCDVAATFTCQGKFHNQGVHTNDGFFSLVLMIQIGGRINM